eukprot:3398090-Amphidinium_carterae.2
MKSEVEHSNPTLAQLTDLITGKADSMQSTSDIQAERSRRAEDESSAAEEFQGSTMLGRYKAWNGLRQNAAPSSLHL